MGLGLEPVGEAGECGGVGCECGCFFFWRFGAGERGKCRSFSCAEDAVYLLKLFFCVCLARAVFYRLVDVSGTSAAKAVERGVALVSGEYAERRRGIFVPRT